MRVRQRAWVEACGYEAGEMGHVHQEHRTDLVGHGANAGEIDDARIGRAACDDHRGLFRACQVLELFVVEQAVVAPHAVLNRAEPLAGLVGRGAVGEMAAGCQAHAEDGVARFDGGEEHRLVRLRAGVEAAH